MNPRFRPLAPAERAEARARLGWPDSARVALVVGRQVVKDPLEGPLASAEVTCLAADREGGLWVGSGSAFPGASRLFNGHWTKHLDAFDQGSGFVHSMRADGESVWFALLHDR